MTLIWMNYPIEIDHNSHLSGSIGWIANPRHIFNIIWIHLNTHLVGNVPSCPIHVTMFEYKRGNLPIPNHSIAQLNSHKKRLCQTASKFLVTPKPAPKKKIVHHLVAIDIACLCNFRISMFFRHTHLTCQIIWIYIYKPLWSTTYPCLFDACSMLSGYEPQLSYLYLHVWAVDHIFLLYAHVGPLAGHIFQMLVCGFLPVLFWYHQNTNELHPPQRLEKTKQSAFN